MRLRCALAVLSLAGCGAPPEELLVAVAASFQEPARRIAERFESESGHRTVLSAGSTGKHYAQIRNGAPFDVLLAADVDHPARLESEGRAVAGSRFTYAIGSLALWSADPSLVDSRGEVLRSGGFERLAIANPRLAPHGAAAEQALRTLGLWERLRGKLVLGENVAQAYQFVATGNAELGFVARSQVQRPGAPPAGSWWEVPPSLHEPLAHQAVLLKPGAAAMAFLDFVRSPQAAAVITAYGYRLPEG